MDHNEVILSEDLEQFSSHEAEPEPEEPFIDHDDNLTSTNLNQIRASLPSLQLERTVHFSSQASISVFMKDVEDKNPEKESCSPTKQKFKRFTWKSIKKNKNKTKEEKQTPDTCARENTTLSITTQPVIVTEELSKELSKLVSASFPEPEFKFRDHLREESTLRRGSISDQLRDGLRKSFLFILYYEFKFYIIILS